MTNIEQARQLLQELIDSRCETTLVACCRGNYVYCNYCYVGCTSDYDDAGNPRYTGVLESKDPKTPAQGHAHDCLLVRVKLWLVDTA